jgi:hypothetical protein
VLADAVLLVHFGFVLFVVAGFAAIVAGAALGWRWIRHRDFRIAHLGAMAFVALESVAGVACPLTVWENALRGTSGDRSFVGVWVARLLYYDLPEWLFTMVYVAFMLAIAAAWHYVPPAPRRGLSLPP